MAETQPKLILIIEDDDDLATTMAQLIGRQGYRVVTSANGREAIERLQAGERPDAILLDMMMPIMNGWEFRAEQTAMPDVADIPVITVTADGSAKEKARAIHAAGVLTKPVSGTNLMNELKRVAGPP